VHEHAVRRIDEQSFLDARLDAQRADELRCLFETLALDRLDAAARDDLCNRIEVVVRLVVLVEIGGDALRDRNDEQRHRSRERAGRDQLRAKWQMSQLQPFHWAVTSMAPDRERPVGRIGLIRLTLDQRGVN
jgi:hypothetical protein